MSYNPDLYWRGGIEEVFPELLSLVFKDAESIFDMDKGFVFMDKELQRLFPEAGNKPDNRIIDKLVKAYRKDGKEEWMLIHLEMQGYNADDFALRMFTYFYRLFEKYKKTPLTSIALFTTHSKPQNAGVFHYEMMGTKLRFEYNAIHIFDYTEAALFAMNNAIGIMLLAARKALLRKQLSPEALGAERLLLAKALLASGKYTHDRILHILAFVKNVIYIESREINATFDHEIDLLTQKGNFMGILELIEERGRIEGIEKGKAEVVSNLLDTGKFSIPEIANFANVTEVFVEKIKKELKK